VGNELRASLAADRRVYGQHAVEQEPQHQRYEGRAATVSMRNGTWPVSLPDIHVG
jgi:hypothetical protein